jgi:hypothetical protein
MEIGYCVGSYAQENTTEKNRPIFYFNEYVGHLVVMEVRTGMADDL